MKARVATITILDKIDFKTKTNKKEERYIMIKGPIQYENIPFVNIYKYAPNIGNTQIYKANINRFKGSNLQ